MIEYEKNESELNDMLSKQMLYNLENSSAIRKMFVEGQELAQKVGAENVFDFSLGNPVAPVPKAFNDALIEIIQNENSLTLHGYTNNAGYPEVRKAVADHLNREFDLGLTEENVIMTVGAAGAINIAFKAILDIDDNVVVFRPYFGEYRSYASNFHAQIVEVDPQLPSFQPDLEDFARKVDARTKAVIINNPVNPSGVVYSEETLRCIAKILEEKQKLYGHEIYLISDEPYRELAYGVEVPFLPEIYRDTVICYSYSKSLSLPGERIGYVAANPRCEDAEYIVPMCGQISRGTGHNCPGSSVQLAVAKVVDETSDLSVYEKNMNLLYDALVRLGFDVVRPGGTFYIFPKALEDDANAFCMKAKDYDLILVPSDSFGVPGYFRMAYCIDTEKVERSIAAFEKFVHEVYGR